MPKYATFEPFLSINSLNSKTIINDFDIDAIYFKNSDLKSPIDKNYVDKERFELLQERINVEG